MKKTYMLIRASKIDGEFTQMFATNTTFKTEEEAMKWLRDEARKNPKDKLIMLDEDMQLYV